jgi:hypothetical protein
VERLAESTPPLGERNVEPVIELLIGRRFGGSGSVDLVLNLIQHLEIVTGGGGCLQRFPVGHRSRDPAVAIALGDAVSHILIDFVFNPGGRDNADFDGPRKLSSFDQPMEMRSGERYSPVAQGLTIQQSHFVRLMLLNVTT